MRRKQADQNHERHGVATTIETSSKAQTNEQMREKKNAERRECRHKQKSARSHENLQKRGYAKGLIGKENRKHFFRYRQPMFEVGSKIFKIPNSVYPRR